MKRILIIITSIITTIGFSQSEPQYAMFWQNASLYNPAQTSTAYQHYANVNYRVQWVGIENNPKTLTAQYETKLKDNYGAIGVGYEHDLIGFTRSNKAYLNYAYHLEVKQVGVLSFGLGVAYERMKFKYGFATPSPGPDPSLPISGVSGDALNVNAGLFYKINNLELGVSSTQINQATIKKINFTNARHLFVYAGYNFHLSPKIELMPRFYYKSDFVAGIWEVNTQLKFDKKYWFGFTYRAKDGLGAQIGCDLKERFRIGYGIEFVTGPLANYGSDTHEITFSFMMPNK
jgi:type IX secretion system PorP/SprF family membrane protein